MSTGIEFLHNVSLFASLSASALEPLAQRLTSRKFRAGEQVFEQGAPGSSLYIVKTGQVEILVTDKDGSSQVVARFGPGQVFGEFALLDGLPRSAGATASERSELLILSRPDFFLVLEQHPAVAINLVVLLSRRLRFTIQRTEHEEESLTPTTRLARVLVDLADRYGTTDGDAVQLAIRLTQGEIAGIMGRPRSEVEQAMEIFRQKRLVDMHGLQVVIHGLDALRDLTSDVQAAS